MNRERSSDGTNDDFQTKKKKRILWGISTSTKRLKLQQQQQKIWFMQWQSHIGWTQFQLPISKPSNYVIWLNWIESSLQCIYRSGTHSKKPNQKRRNEKTQFSAEFKTCSADKKVKINDHLVAKKIAYNFFSCILKNNVLLFFCCERKRAKPYERYNNVKCFL